MGTRISHAPLLALLGLLSLLACDSEPSLLGFDEPVIATHAELKDGKLPGESAKDGARITSLQLNFGVLTPGAPKLTVSGRASGDAYAVGLRIEELGTGYWLKPVGAADPSVPDELTFEYTLSAAVEIEPGQHTFVAAAFDKDGHAGPHYEIPVCVVSGLPDNGNSCDPDSEPPPAIVSLIWHADADLDLTVKAPNGKLYDRSNRFLLRDDGSQSFGLAFDGFPGCLRDGRRRENFVFNDRPPRGSSWLVYANLFDGCGHAAVPYELIVYRSKKNANGSFRLEAEKPVRGEFLRAQQNGGAGTPLYLTAVEF
jgi:hypothetical protein